MRNSPSGPRGKPSSKQSGKPLAAPAMPPAKLGSERADKASTIGGRSKTGYTDYDLAGRARLAVLYEGEEREMRFETPTEQVAFEIPDEWRREGVHFRELPPKGHSDSIFAAGTGRFA